MIVTNSALSIAFSAMLQPPLSEQPAFKAGALLPTDSDMRWPEVQFSIPVAHSLSTGTVSPDNRIKIYSYALRKSKPTSFLKIAGHTRVGRKYH
jgi:hypothetical protein